MKEARSFNFTAIRPRASVGNKIHSELPLRGFCCDITFACRDHVPFGIQLKMMD
jgi:hypothetical protein